MTEAQHMHDDLLRTLHRLIPRTIYQDSRRLNTLAWAITGLCLTQTVRLSAWAELAPSRSQHAARRVRRFSRWLHHSAIVPCDWYQPVMLAALSNWPAGQDFAQKGRVVTSLCEEGIVKGTSMGQTKRRTLLLKSEQGGSYATAYSILRATQLV